MSVDKLLVRFGLKPKQRALEEELSFHLEQQVQANLAAGMSAEDARRHALIAFGGVQQTRERVDELRWTHSMEILVQDARHALRLLLRNPSFASIAILALALGIGANSAIFSIVNAVVLKPLPYKDPEQLVQIWMRFTGIGIPNDRNWVSPPEFQDLQQNSSLSYIAATDENSFNVKFGSAPERVQSAAVSTSFFPMLGVQAQVGRTFLPEEGLPGHEHVVLLSDGLWRARFGADPNITGHSLVMNGQNYEIVGVLPRDFQMPRDAEVWIPLVFASQDLAPDNRGSHGLLVMGRIKPGLTLEQAKADMQAVSQRIIQQNPKFPYAQFNFTVLLVPLLEQMVGDIRLALWVLMGAVGLVLLIACSNVANLLLVRASAREREIAVRQALGVGRWRLIRQLLTESAVLGLVGGIAGLMVAYVALRVLTNLGQKVFPRIAEVEMDWHVLVFTVLVSLITGVLFGLAPAIRGFRKVSYESLKEGGHGSSAGAASQRLRGTLVVVEMALSLILLAGAGLLIRSFLRLQEVNGGFRADGVLTMRISLPPEKYPKPEQTRIFYHQLLDRVRHLPGVDEAGAVNGLPLSGSGGSGTATIDTQAVAEKDRTPEVDYRPVTPGYFPALSIPLVRGRFFDEHDNETAQPVAMVDETLAQTYWPNEDPIGHRVHAGGVRSKSPWLTIVGVVKHVRYRTLESPSRCELYLPYAQLPFTQNSMSLVIHSSADPRSLIGLIQGEVRAIDPDQPVYKIRTMQEWVSDSMAERRLSMSLLAIFAGIALLLAAIGLYGVMSYSVAQRAHEMGIRMALGARAGDLLGMVMRQGLVLSVLGVFVGVIGSLLLSHFLSTLVFQTRTVDPATFAAVASVLMLVCLLACFVPAWRAATVDPVNVLREE